IDGHSSHRPKCCADIYIEIPYAEDLPQAMRRRSLTEARSTSLPLVSFTRQSRWSVKSTNPPLGGY
ncbi:MAG: hypothetical protein FWE67_01695, partial [Planctomycetaceae bacterium]|nr:hypothetical protein [Planctomycetaceae bacterium]